MHARSLPYSGDSRDAREGSGHGGREVDVGVGSQGSHSSNHIEISTERLRCRKVVRATRSRSLVSLIDEGMSESSRYRAYAYSLSDRQDTRA